MAIPRQLRKRVKQRVSRPIFVLEIWYYWACRFVAVAARWTKPAVDRYRGDSCSAWPTVHIAIETGSS